jgi:methyl-accepting chemotaxis protein
LIDLNKLKVRLNRDTGKLTKASDGLSSISSQLSKGSEGQAAALQETAASVDEVSAMIKKTSDNAFESQKTSNMGRTSVEEGNRQISDIVKVISEIGNKTKVINDIVFQTKLLSFNASVEAARAGEHGKGFAVVAEEVGNLAQMSGKAAKEISDMLSESITKVENIVQDTKVKVERSILEGKSKVDTGTATAKNCHSTLEKIIASVVEVDGMVVEIAAASSEQALGISEIKKAMNQLDEVTHFNSTMALDASKYSQGLKKQSLDLSKMVTELVFLIDGKEMEKTSQNLEVSHDSDDRGDEVINKERKIKKHPPQQEKNSGVDITPPSADDSRFEDI